MTQTPSHQPVNAMHAFAQVAFAALGTAAALALIGYFPTRAAAGADGVPAMLLGIGVSLVGGWCGSLLTFLFVNGPAARLVSGGMLGLAARFVITLGLAVAVRSMDLVPHVPLLLWVGLSQVAILAADTVGLLRVVNATPKEAR